MKTFNTKFVVALITTLLLTGCMPDSLTKFKKEEVKKSATTGSDSTTTPPITDDSGNAVDPDTLTFPTKFFYKTEGTVAEDKLKVGTAYTTTPTTDGTLADSTTRGLIFLKCELVTTGAVITRTLPPGLTLNQSTCTIAGTPTTIYADTTSGNIGGTIEYTVRMSYKGANYTVAGTESSLLATIKIGIYDTPAALNMTQNDKLQIKLSARSGLLTNIQTNTDSTLSYNRYGVLSSNKTISGIIKYVDTATSTVGVVRTQPIVVASVIPYAVNGFVSTASKRGKILSINATTKTLYVEALTASSIFAVGDALDNASTFLSAKSTVTAIDSTFKFTKGDKVDNDTQYFSEKFNIDSIIQTYERGATIPSISPIMVTTLQPSNGIVWSISPALPAGLSFSTSTGIISGSFTSTLDATDFTVTATNPIGESSYVVTVAAINSPRDLSYTSNQLISVNSNATFLEGESIFQPIKTPLTYSVSGRISRKVSTNKLSIDTLNGAFLSEASLDSGNAYYSEKSYVTLSSDPNYFNLALSVSSTTAFTAGDYITSSTGAKGRVIYVDSSNGVLYVQFLTPTVISSTPASATITTFAQGTTLDNAYPFVAPETTITQVEAAQMALTITNTTGFDPGHDLTTGSNHSGYIYDWDTTNDIIKVDEINRTNAVGGNYLRIGQDLDPSEYYGSSSAQISGVTHDNLIVLERGVARVVKANMSQGTSVIYSVSPSLPLGLTLNTTDGTISGTATMKSARKSYVVTATNLLDKAYYAFDLEVRDYFTFAEASGAKSFLTHKTGINRTHRGCRINSTDIINGNSQALDIGCNLEAEELELFYSKLKLTANVGAGTCEYIGFRPYSFWQYAPDKTLRTIKYLSGCTGGSATGTTTTTLPTAENACYGNYTSEKGPNCDTGTVTVETYTASSGTTCDTVSTSTISCGGTKIACLSGPVRDVMSEAELKAGYRSKTVAAAAGGIGSWTIESSADSLEVTNLRTANGLVNNSCTDTRADANAWVAINKSIPSTQHPFGAGESPFYEFTCLDAAQDIKARIRLTVRDWDRTFRINDAINSVLPAKMNVNTLDSFGVSYNNKFDWDDTYSLYADKAAIATCGVIPGTCSDPTYTTAADCASHNKDWIIGTCDVPGYTTPTTCEKEGGEWTTINYRFPAGEI